MKKIITSAGLVAVGAVSLNAQYAPELTRQEASKPWTVSAALRGFYDDNYATVPNNVKKGSGGFEFKPGIAYNLPLEQTFIKMSYEYDLKYYFDRHPDLDQGHDFEGKLDHRFSDRYRVTVADSFVYAQEPEIIDPSISTPLRTQANAIRNRGGINFDAQITQVIGAQVGYENLLYDYLESGNGSRAALLNRMEQRIHIDGHYQIQEHLIGLLGYQYEIIDYTSNDLLSTNPGALPADSRNATRHDFYGGVDHAFTSQLSGAAKVGAQYTDYSNLHQNTWGPFVDMQGTYTYLPGSYVQLGARVSRNPTDLVGDGTAANLTLDAESASVYGSLNHRITPQLTGSLLGQYVYSKFRGGAYDGEADNFFIVGLNLEYKINNYWAVELGYNFDRLDSDIPDRSFSRNRVYGGVRAKY